MAAGLGSRYGSFKQIDGLGPSGEFLLDYAVYDAMESGYGKVVFVVSEAILEEIKCRFFDLLGKEAPLEFVVQRKEDLPEGPWKSDHRVKPWGTGHAVWVARHHIREPFNVINADDY